MGRNNGNASRGEGQWRGVDRQCDRGSDVLLAQCLAKPLYQSLLLLLQNSFHSFLNYYLIYNPYFRPMLHCVVNCNVCMFLLWLPYGVINYNNYNNNPKLII